MNRIRSKAPVHTCNPTVTSDQAVTPYPEASSSETETRMRSDYCEMALRRPSLSTHALIVVIFGMVLEGAPLMFLESEALVRWFPNRVLRSVRSLCLLDTLEQTSRH